MRTGDALKLTATALTALVFGYFALVGRIENQNLGVVFLALVLWSLYPKRHLESSVLIIAL
jgi:hypothetical protein